MTATATTPAAVSLYHPHTHTTVQFTPYADGTVSVCSTFGTHGWSSHTMSTLEAREFWKAWLKLGAVDLRKHVVIDGAIYKREADGTISSGLCASIYDYPDFAKYTPKGYTFKDARVADRDDGLDHDEISYTLWFARAA